MFKEEQNLCAYGIFEARCPPDLWDGPMADPHTPSSSETSAIFTDFTEFIFLHLQPSQESTSRTHPTVPSLTLESQQWTQCLYRHDERYTNSKFFVLPWADFYNPLVDPVPRVTWELFSNVGRYSVALSSDVIEGVSPRLRSMSMWNEVVKTLFFFSPSFKSVFDI